MAIKRIYGKYAPISPEARDMIDSVYGDKEKKEREIAYAVSEMSEPIDQTVLFNGATAINAAYMRRNTKPVPNTNLLSPRIRDFNDDKVEKEILEGIKYGDMQCEVVLVDIETVDGFDKRKNFDIKRGCLYRITSGKYAGLCFTTGVVTKDGKTETRLLLDIANTPFAKLTESWQKDNYDPFEFAYKLVQAYPGLSVEEYAAIVHVYWLSANDWAIKYNDPMGVPYGDLVRAEQVKDGDNVVVASTFAKTAGKELTEEECKQICELAMKEVDKKIAQEQGTPTDEDIITA